MTLPGKRFRVEPSI